ncbi:MAG: S-layer homology domain-containing protein [Oscillospiraceae bacterium]|nr:S-layer homology domain-containing protein [Oscillospiraceae bacterium]
MKRLTRRAFALLLALTLTVPAHAADAAQAALLPRAQTYAGQFADVDAGDWYYPYVAAAYEYALMNGRGSGFAPDAEITVAELLTLSARLRAAHAGDAIADTEPWSVEPYVAYLRAQGVYDDALTPHLSERATRAQLAGVFAVSLPEDCFDGRNDTLVTDAYASGGFIADVSADTPCQPQILWLYRQGLLVGVDGAGSYRPNDTTTRAETAAIVARMADPALRLTPDWVVLPPWSAAGTTLSSIVKASAYEPTTAPEYDDVESIDTLVRRMLAAGENTIALQYSPQSVAPRYLEQLVNSFLTQIKFYCEQMYDSILCRPLGNYAYELTFSAASCTGEQLARYREAAMARAIEVHDMLWETGQLDESMSQYEIAKVYFLWLCDNCAYDWDNVDDDRSICHLAYSALVNGKAVCDGYTGAYDLFLRMEGIDCYALYNRDHIWTVATLDNATYHIDVTWGDQSGRVDMDCFGMTIAESYRLHPW